ncbi:MAG: Gfo/Idh/MocA family oxidoreductase [Devosia sp.]|uniref:Gfo/Idh/MocA family protein n=1 Tax=Devosia sp. TaxID=1871048 RepID=UPI0024C9995A|nr:Gfo/Idh/MocA family oxidoreductase [Devosia sp.]UYO00217.1 MAG: Gfo/Idh/MocA family oxidoreductase [Devosia sp.]
MQYQIDAQHRLRIGIVGVGSHAYRNILPTLSYLPVELTAIADVDVARAEKVARQFGVGAVYQSAEDMYANADIEAVLLVVSAGLHPQLAISAFRHGLHVYMEKPAAARAEQVEHMLAARGDRVCVVGYKKAFMPATRKALEIIGDAQNAPLRTLMGLYPISLPENIVELVEAGEPNAWLANGCHPLSALLTLAGPATAVTMHRGRHDGGAAIIEHACGAISNLHLAAHAPGSQPIERYFAVAGSSSIEIVNSRELIHQRGIEFKYSHATSYLTGEGAQVWAAQNHLNSPENMPVMTQGLFGGLKHFFDCVLSQQPVSIGTLEFAHHLTKVWEAVAYSQGKRIVLN